MEDIEDVPETWPLRTRVGEIATRIAEDYCVGLVPSTSDVQAFRYWHRVLARAELSVLRRTVESAARLPPSEPLPEL